MLKINYDYLDVTGAIDIAARRGKRLSKRLSMAPVRSESGKVRQPSKRLSMALATIGDDLQIQLGDVHSQDDFSVGETRALEEASQRIGGEVLMDMLLETDSGHEHYFSNQPTVAAVAQDREASGPQQRQRHRGLFPIEMMPNGGRAAGSKDSWVNAHIAQCKFERDTHGTFH